MARKIVKERRPVLDLKAETKHGVWAIILFVLAVFLFFANVGWAGPAGRTVYKVLKGVVGYGFTLFPITTALLGFSFLQPMRPNLIRTKIIGGLLFLVAGLGLLELIVGNETGGLIGSVVSRPLESLFNSALSIIILSALVVISVLLLFETQITLDFTLFKWRPSFRRKQTELNETGESVALLAEPPLPAVVTSAEEVEEDPEPRVAQNFNLEKESGFVPVRFARRQGDETFTPPPLSLLGGDSGKPAAGDIKANANIIKRTLANFGIMVEMDEVSIGPSITRYALKPAEGVKLSKIISLQDNLSLALAAHPLRIEAPIPGKSLVGIEIPNSQKTTVGLSALLGSNEYTSSADPLLVSLGRGVSGTSHFASASRAPHMLIAGATGSGKSVVIHTFLMSLLYRQPPDRLRFIMIDPKRVELTIYNKIPHLLTPVVTDPKKAILVLKWAIGEMERRYAVLEERQVRDIKSFHEQMTDDEEETMPYIVIIIDELADIMTSYPRELEAAIVRLAQMSRAVGIHLVLSTQRPSVEVITGLIKANIPTRVALQVASQIDSRTILDMGGAEKLLGAGDMLYLSGDMSKPLRLQAAYVSEAEVKKVVKWLIEHYGDFIPSDIALSDSNSVSIGGDSMDDNGDDLYNDAKEVVFEAGKASASLLQRRLKVGYARAARLLDILEERGVIGPGDGAKPREVYLTSPGLRGASPPEPAPEPEKEVF